MPAPCWGTRRSLFWMNLPWVLDPRQIIEIRELIKSLGKKHTVILSSHILSEVSAVCDHILIISKGKLVASNTPEGLGKLMQRTNVYDMLVQGDHERLGELLKGVHGLQADHRPLPMIRDLPPSIWRRMKRPIPGPRCSGCWQEPDCPIMELKSATISLEDVFLELTAQDMQTEGRNRT